MQFKEKRLEDLPKQCQSCLNLKTVSVYMDGTSSYRCNKSPRSYQDIVKEFTTCPYFSEEIVDIL